jgi:hypothetical protein
MDADKNPVVLRMNKPFTTADSSIRLRGLLRPGEYQFQLVVIDGAGKHSQPALVSVTVEEPATLWLASRSWLVAVLKLLSGLLGR